MRWRSRPLSIPGVALITGLGLFAGLALNIGRPVAAAEPIVLAPVAKVDATPTRKLETAVFAGGCFWGVEGVFSHVNGVKRVVSGYAGGPKGMKVDYDRVSTGRTGYAESVRVTYDPAQVSYGQLLRIFFSVVADPTTLNYQGPDRGTQYRSALFPLDGGQEKAARAYLAQLSASGVWDGRIVTTVESFRGFQDAEGEHQDFMARNPGHPYIRRWDAPKLTAFRKLFPQMYRAKASY